MAFLRTQAGLKYIITGTEDRKEFQAVNVKEIK